MLLINRPKNPLISPLNDQKETTAKIQPSQTFKEYSDPSGFSFSYPDNLSLENKEIEDDSVYADIQLFSTGVSGSLNLKISDSKLKSIEEWVKSNSFGETPKEVKLGSLKAFELRLKDRLLLGALDQGVLFTIEMPLVEENFWMEVYEKILADFSFTAPGQESTASQGGSSSSNDVIFEGEEVVE